MDKIPYDNHDHPYWEDEYENNALWELLEPSDFYFFIPSPENGPYYDPNAPTWYISIISKRFFDEKGYWYDDHLRADWIAKKHGCQYNIGCEDETTYSLWPTKKNATPAQVKAALEQIGFIWNPKIYDDLEW